MELMIPLPLTVPDTPLSLDELEERCISGGSLSSKPPSPAHGRRRRRCVPTPPARTASRPAAAAGSRSAAVETRFGPVRLARARVRCRGCGRHFQPDDAALKPLLGAGQCTPMLRELAAQCGASWPYRQAAQVLGHAARRAARGRDGAADRRPDGGRGGMPVRPRGGCSPVGHRRPPHRRHAGPAQVEIVLDGAMGAQSGQRARDGDQGRRRPYRQRAVRRDPHPADRTPLCRDRGRRRCLRPARHGGDRPRWTGSPPPSRPCSAMGRHGSGGSVPICSRLRPTSWIGGICAMPVGARRGRRYRTKRCASRGVSRLEEALDSGAVATRSPCWRR